MKRHPSIPLAIAIAAFAAAFAAAGVAEAQMRGAKPRPGVRADVLPVELEGVEIDEKLGLRVATSARLKTETGEPIEFGSLFDGQRPVLLTFYYSSCPMLCSVSMGDLIDVLNKSPWPVGDKFRIVSVSMDAKETYKQAFETKEGYLDRYQIPEISDKERFTFVEKATDALGESNLTARWRDSVTGRLPTAQRVDARTALAEGWTFLTGDEENIRAVADSVGFNFNYVEAKKEFAHPTAIIVLSPRGKVVSYLHGLSYEPEDLTSRVVSAALDEPTASTAQFLYSCFHFVEPSGFAAIAIKAMRYGGFLFVLLLVAVLVVLHRRRRSDPRSETT